MNWLGTILIIAGCGYAGIAAGIAYKREEAALEQLCEHLQYMICRLKFHQISLPELFSYLEKEAKPPLRAFYANVIRELNMRTFPDAPGCLKSAVDATVDLPQHTRSCLLLLGRFFGRFDLEGQLRGAESVYEICREKYMKMAKKHTVCIRSYLIFGLCGGAAIAVLLI